MLDATIKHIFQYTLLSACLFCSFSCGNSKQAEDSEKAEQIMSEIKSMYAGKDYDNGQNVELVTFNAQECGDFLSFIAQNTAY